VTSSLLPLCAFLFLLGFQPLLAQDCQNVDTSTCFINKKYKPGPIQLELKSTSIIDEIISEFSLLSFADVSGDCYPEIIVKGQGKRILILNPASGDTLFSVPILASFFLNPNIAIANIDDDQIPELFHNLHSNSGVPASGRIVCTNLNGTTRWVSDDYHVDKKREQCKGTIGFADFNQDGIPEVYVGNRIFNARTGAKLADGGDFGIGYNESFGASVAAQLDGDPSDLELAAGYTIYKVKITNPDGPLGNSMTPNTIQVDGQFRDGLTAIGDINSDGILDVIVHSETPQFEARLYAYTLASGTPTLLAKVIPPVNTWNNSKNIHPTNTPVIGRVSPFGFSSILIVREEQLLSYQYDGTTILAQQWTFPHTDKSANTSIALFDLNGDGNVEIIHRDETHLRIIDGSSSVPMEIASAPCESSTVYEGPIVGDILNNGSSQICVTCTEGIAANFKSRVKIFGSPDSLPPWAPGRKVWNQYAYHINNVNDDLTIPVVQKSNATDLNGRYNSFMEQQSLLDTNGYYRQRAGSLYGELGCIYYDPISQQYTISFDLHNRVDASMTAPAGIPVAFYDGDPLTSGNLLGVYLTPQPLLAGESLLNQTFPFTSPPFTQLHMVVNTDKAVFSSIDEDDFSIDECDYTDNFSMTIDLPLIEERADTMCAGDAYIFFDSTITSAGTYYHKGLNILGCDSLVVSLHLVTKDSVQVLASHTACDSFSWQGNTYLAGGLYSEVFNGPNGCDSTLILDLDLRYATQAVIDQSACDSFHWFGNVLTQSNLYTHLLTNEVGCDSTITLQLTIHTAQVDTVHESACQSYFWHGQSLDVSGIYSFDTLSQFGCDSTAYLDLTVHDSIFRQESISICQGDSVFIFDQYESTEKTLAKTFISSEGCDSLHTVQLFVLPLPPASYDTIPLCHGDTLLLFGQEVFASADLSSTYAAQNGCDSTAFLHVQVIPLSTSTLAYTLCPQDSVFFAGQWITSSGSYQQFLQAHNGCDSLITAVVTALDDVAPPTSSLDCDNLVIEVDVDAQAPWRILWDNGDTTAHTIYADASTATLTLLAEPDCERQFIIDLPSVPDIEDVMHPGDTIIQAGSSIAIDLGLDPQLWSVRWIPAHIVNCDTCTQVIISTLENTDVTIVFTHISGCIFQTAFAIHISGGDVFVPNSFSPNGDDANDIFTIYGNASINFVRNLNIYDRWGSLLYYREDLNINDPSQGWDGLFRGEMMPPGVYVYTFEVVFADGSVRLFKGDVTLVR
jgi:gliding motility-associated-like protein